MTASPAGGDPIKVGVIADQTGPLSIIGLANANVARMVIGDINAKGGLLGRPLELHLEDSATDDEVAAEVARKLVEQDEVDVVLGGIYSSTRQAIKGPVVVEGKTLYIYPEQYEGQESDPLDLLHRAGAGAAGRPVHPVADAGDRGEDLLPAVRRLHLAARDERARARGRHGERRGDRGRGVLPARSRRLPRDGRPDHARAGADVVFNTTVPPGVAPFLEQLHDSGFSAAAGSWSAPTSRRTCSAPSRRRTSRGCTAASTTTRPSATRSARGSWPSTTRSTPVLRSSPAAAGARASTAGCASGRPP